MPGVPLATQDCRMTGSVLPCRLWCSCAAVVVKELHVHRNMQFGDRCRDAAAMSAVA